MARISLVLMLLLALSSQSFAQDDDGDTNKKDKKRPVRMGVCKPEFDKICEGLRPGDGKFMECVKEHYEEFSPECKSEITERKNKMEQSKKDCENDAKKFCANVKPGDGRIIECLKSHENDLSSACKSHLSRKR